MSERVPSDILNHALHHLGRSGEPQRFIQIGAMDGVSFDDVAAYIDMYGWTGLYVEPVPSAFAALVRNRSGQGHRFERSAIVEKDGPVEMLIIDPVAIEQRLVHDCFAGMSAVWPPRNGLASEGDRAVVEQYGQRIVVRGITLATLFKKHDIPSFDMFLVDTEGLDWVVLNQLDLRTYRPQVIRLERINLSDQDLARVREKLTSHGYITEEMGQNIDGVLTSLWDAVRD